MSDANRDPVRLAEAVGHAIARLRVPLLALLALVATVLIVTVVVTERRRALLESSTVLIEEVDRCPGGVREGEFGLLPVCADAAGALAAPDETQADQPGSVQRAVGQHGCARTTRPKKSMGSVFERRLACVRTPDPPPCGSRRLCPLRLRRAETCKEAPRSCLIADRSL